MVVVKLQPSSLEAAQQLQEQQEANCALLLNKGREYGLRLAEAVKEREGGKGGYVDDFEINAPGAGTATGAENVKAGDSVTAAGSENLESDDHFEWWRTSVVFRVFVPRQNHNWSSTFSWPDIEATLVHGELRVGSMKEGACKAND